MKRTSISRPVNLEDLQAMHRMAAALVIADPVYAPIFERVDIGTDGLNVRLRVDGLGSLAREMLAGGIKAAA